MSDERSNPVGFYNFGVSFLDVARCAANGASQIKFRDPFEFLISHGLELIFKADIGRSISLVEAKQRFGHRLPDLISRLSNEFIDHFEIGEELRALVSYLDQGHSGGEWRNRYLQTGVRPGNIELYEMLRIVSRFDTGDRRWLLRTLLGL